MTESEVWKDVVGYEGLYKVSNKGDVFSIERKDSRGIKCGGRTLKPAYTQDGYLRVTLNKNGIRRSKYIHRLVAEAFILKPNNYLEVNHLDEVKTNNNVSNLEWCTRKYNMNYGARNEKVAQKLNKKVRASNVETGDVLTFSSTLEAGRKGYSRVNVGLACNGVYKNANGKLIGGDGRTYKGHRWSYE